MALPAYDQCIKASHVFNLLDARGVISVTERQSYILRVRELAKACGEAWLHTEAEQGGMSRRRRSSQAATQFAVEVEAGEDALMVRGDGRSTSSRSCDSMRTKTPDLSAMQLHCGRHDERAVVAFRTGCKRRRSRALVRRVLTRTLPASALMPDLLLELFSEEIPARMQAKAADDLRRMVTDKLVAEGLVYEGAKAFATPRRLALTVHGIPRAATRPEGRAQGAARRRRRTPRSRAF